MDPRLLPEAEEELFDIVARYETEQQGLGIRFASAFEQTVHRVRDDPSSWPITMDEFSAVSSL